MQISLAQINPKVGAFKQNARKICKVSGNKSELAVGYLYPLWRHVRWFGRNIRYTQDPGIPFGQTHKPQEGNYSQEHHREPVSAELTPNQKD
ncbi:MAG: hypothetical protein MRK01_06500 [Candidatus Scalindua sp.]|nr:hypothetical protein [Candidatus Scalindua sp.]